MLAEEAAELRAHQTAEAVRARAPPDGLGELSERAHDVRAVGEAHVVDPTHRHGAGPGRPLDEHGLVKPTLIAVGQVPARCDADARAPGEWGQQEQEGPPDAL